MKRWFGYLLVGSILSACGNGDSNAPSDVTNSPPLLDPCDTDEDCPSGSTCVEDEEGERFCEESSGGAPPMGCIDAACGYSPASNPLDASVMADGGTDAGAETTTDAGN